MTILAGPIVEVHYDYVHWINMYMGLCMQQKGVSTIQGYVCRGYARLNQGISIMELQIYKEA